ncbi:MAG: superoxide dismutase, Ni [Pseudomonadota bacterium]
MLFTLLEHLDKNSGFPVAKAHCDIPCGIYDPISAQLAALTVIRTVDLLNDLAEKDSLTVNEQAQFGRLVAEKESHGLKVKEEVRVIWGDYFKPPHFEDMPELQTLCHSIMMAASKAKQHVSREAAGELLTLVNEFAAAFWKTKGVETYTAECPYAPNEMVVYPKLG